MKIIRIMVFAAAALISNGCGVGEAQTKTSLSATEFSSKMAATPSAAILDVRTAGEFSKGHIQHAQNIDWNEGGFIERVKGIPKNRPVFVYCLSGGRSAAAASTMRAAGYTEVYELNGGLMKWRGANLPESSETGTTSRGLSLQQFNQSLESGKLVLVDFYAEWCPPCKKMKPYLDEISSEMKDKVVVMRINADDNQDLIRALKIDGLPVLHIYKNKQLQWSHTGFIEKEAVMKELH
jgi:thioredoxin